MLSTTRWQHHQAKPLHTSGTMLWHTHLQGFSWGEHGRQLPWLSKPRVLNGLGVQLMVAHVATLGRVGVGPVREQSWQSAPAYFACPVTCTPVLHLAPNFCHLMHLHCIHGTTLHLACWLHGVTCPWGHVRSRKRAWQTPPLWQTPSFVNITTLAGHWHVTRAGNVGKGRRNKLAVSKA